MGVSVFVSGVNEGARVDVLSGDEAIRRQVAGLRQVREAIIACQRCVRLIEYIQGVAKTKRRAYQDWEYWGRPVPSLGDPRARLLVVGLAPAAHGGNRTGRMFTGDSSADWLMRAMHRAGFANQPVSTHIGDGLDLKDAYITAVCHCAPPANKPTRGEIENCAAFLSRELDLLQTAEVIVCLGQIAFDNVLRRMRDKGWDWPVAVESVPTESGEGDGRRRTKPRFRHGGEYVWCDEREGAAPSGKGRVPVLVASYHPSRQNTNTGVLTEAMFDAVFQRARDILTDSQSSM